MCDYKAKYYDYEKRKVVLYKCPHEPSKPRCMFHDGSSYKSRPNDVRNEFYKMVEDAIQNDQPLYCIGFNLPDITVKGKFTKPVYFFRAIFQKADFSNATFQEADFPYATFKQQANFFRAIFQKADFSNATFQQQANFSYATFKQQVYFLSAIFQQEADFSNATFQEADFPYATFQQQANFAGAIFQEANFAGATFKQQVYFSYATFKQQVYFSYATFQQQANFLNATFKQQVYFSDAIFQKADFLDADFIGEVEFINTTFPNEDRTNKHIPIRFDYSTFRSRVRFIGNSDKPLDLSNVSFKGVNLDNVEFHNVRWREDKVLRFIKRNIIADELFMDELKNYQEVSRIYNQLRKNYEIHLHFTEASHFFIGEMEAIRRSLWSKGIGGKLASIPYLLYKYIALYGENVFLPLVLWTPTIIIGFAVWRMLVSNCYDPQCMIDRVIDSIAAYFQVPRNALQQDIIERILAIPILGSAFIALRRRFERRK
jgi:uncharacterized protein YjbI with pentapeptide repeats